MPVALELCVDPGTVRRHQLRRLARLPRPEHPLLEIRFRERLRLARLDPGGLHRQQVLGDRPDRQTEGAWTLNYCFAAQSAASTRTWRSSSSASIALPR